MTVEITQTVFEQYEQVRQSGMTNMIMQNQVQQVADSMGHYELVSFIESGDYHELLENYEQYSTQYQ